MKEKEEKEKKKDNQYHLKKAMGLAIAIGLKTSFLLQKFAQTIIYHFYYIFADKKHTLSLSFFFVKMHILDTHGIANIVTAPPLIGCPGLFQFKES